MSRRSEIDTPWNIFWASMFCLTCMVIFVVGMNRIFAEWERPKPAYVPPEVMIQADQNSVLIERVVPE